MDGYEYYKNASRHSVLPEEGIHTFSHDTVLPKPKQQKQNLNLIKPLTTRIYILLITRIYR